ncbi:MAG: hypothetical protein EOM26_02835 [Alphaproteobacteria bacterium]|nr:hypothetical protein [Alphaproteobacteria bacterium]
MQAFFSADKFRKIAASAGFLDSAAQRHVVRMCRDASVPGESVDAAIGAFERDEALDRHVTLFEANAMDLPDDRAARISSRLDPQLKALVEEICEAIEGEEPQAFQRARLFELQLFSELAWNIAEEELASDPNKAAILQRLADRAVEEAEESSPVVRLKIGGREP